MRCSIRPAGEEDSDAISGLVSSLGYQLDADAVRERIARYHGGGDAVLVAEVEGLVKGFLSFHVIPLFHQAGGLGRITALAVDPACHRQGIGRALAGAAEKLAAACGCLRMEVTSGDHREHDAHVFYQVQGYRTDCRRFIKDL